MGEARRRKQLDPSYGKPKLVVEITVLEFATQMYLKYGVGLVYVHSQGIGYVLPSHVDISQMDSSLMDSVDYKNTFVVTELGSGGLFATCILESNNPVFKRKLRTREDWLRHSSEFVYE